LKKRYAAFALIALALVAAGAANAQTLKFSPSSISLYALSGPGSSPSQTISVTSSDNTTVIPFNVAPTVGWINLSAAPSGGWKTPASVTISVNPSLLPLGPSTGALNFSTTGIPLLTVPVNVTVSTIGVTVPVTGGQSNILELGTYQAGSTVFPASVPSLLVAGDIANLKIAQPASDTWYTYGTPQQFGTPPALSVSVALNDVAVALLSPGTYTSALTLTPEGFNPVPVVIPVTFTVTPSPQVTWSPASLVFYWQRNGNNQTKQYLTLSSNASQAIALSLSASVSWVTVPVTNPSIPANGSVQVEIDVPEPAGDAQPTGASNGLIQIAIPGGGALFPNGTTSVSIPIQLSITSSPVLYVANTPLSFTNVFGSTAITPPSYTLVPSSTGAAVSYIAAGVPTDNWVVVSPPSTNVQTTDSGSFTVTVNPAGMLPGTYNSHITVTPQANGSGQGPVTIPVSLTVNFPNSLQTSLPLNPLICGGKPPCLVFEYQTGQTAPPSQTVNLSTTTGAPLNYTITPPAATAGWIQVSGPLTGTTDVTSFTVSIVPSGIGNPLPPSPQDATINIVATDPTTNAVVTTLNIDVKLYLSATPQLVASATQSTVSWLPPLQLTTWPNSKKYPGNDQGPVFVYLSSSQPVTEELTNVANSWTVTSQATTGDWLTPASPYFGTPTSFTVSAVRDPNRMPYGIYDGAVSVTAALPPNGTPVANSPITIPVRFIVNQAYSSATWFGSPNPLSFTQTKGGSAPPSQVVQVTTDGSTSLPFDPVVNTGLDKWITVSGITGLTPGSFNVSVDASNLTIGTHTGAIYVNIPNASPNADGSPLRIPVTFTVNGGAICAGSCTSEVQSLTFTQVAGGSAPPDQQVAVVSTPSSIAYSINATVTTPANGIWLQASISAGGGVTPGTVDVKVTPGSLAAGTYTGIVTITSPGATNSPIQIAVTLNVVQATLSAPTTALQFSQLAGGPAPAAQQIAVTSNPPGVPFNVTTTTGSGVPWLTATVGSSGTNGTTPGTVAVSVNSGLLSPGQYSGLVTIASAGAIGSPISINVLLNVGAASVLTVTPSALTFGASVGQATTPQTVQLTASASTSYTATAATSDTGNWLSVNPTSGTAGTSAITLTVSANTQNLAVGSYSGTVTISSASSLNPVVVNVSLTVAAVPTPVITKIQNAASNQLTGVSPGENIVLYGTGIGPATLTVVSQLTSAGKFPTTLANTQVLFDGVAAPIYYASATQTSVFVPYGVGGRAATNVQVVYLNVPSVAVPYTVAQAVPGIYTLNFSGTGPGAILNQDNSVNASNNPAAKGSVVQVYMTGEGATTPGGTDGALAGTPGYPLAAPILQPVTATVGGLSAVVDYAGSAPGEIYGFMQVNITIPATTPSGAQPVVIKIGAYATQAGVTLAVQ
jgi:uncharacterized protein (TIGR03437 family)